MKKILFYSLLLLNFLYPFCIMTNLLDGDLGWHLRFGQELHSGGPFPHLDTYTYAFYGQPWVNHEWGGDWLLWLIYDRIGYIFIDVLMALSVVASTLIIGKIFYKKINSLYLAISFLALYAAQPVWVGRLAMLTPLFFALTIFCLEKFKTDRRFAFIIPPLLCIWSMLHGSFTLGFIVIGIYLSVALFENLLNKNLQKYTNEKPLSYRDILYIGLGALLGSLLIAINSPYGLDIWKESIAYFGQSFYKNNITEWVPAYTFPIFWKILIIQTIALFFAIYGFFKKKLGLTQLAIFSAFFYSAIMYKRQMIFMAILCPVILSYTAEYLKNEMLKIKIFQGETISKIITPFLILTVLILNTNFLIKSFYTNDPWNSPYLINNNNSNDYDAIMWLKNNSTPGSKIFNEFSWGAGLNWMLKDNLIFLDGRGTVTWRYNSEKTMLERYSDIYYKPGGLEAIEVDGADYIYLKSSNFATFGKPDWVNRMIVGEKIFDKDGIFFQKSELEKELDNSTDWKKVFASERSNIWKKINLEQP